jgi:DNA-binding NarL/FixJ family response regulator
MTCSASSTAPGRAATPPEPTRVAIAAGAAQRERIVRSLGARVEIVPFAQAEVVVRDAAAPADALTAIAEGFSVPTILLVDEPHAELAFAALRAGASAVLARQSDARELLAALDAVGAGLLVLDASVREAPPAGTLSQRTALVEALTERERQVLAMLAGGLSNRRIADRLAISENTVKAHVAAILAKLGAATRTEAVTLGLRLGLVML